MFYIISMNQHELLRRIWKRSAPGYVFLPTKDRGEWIEAEAILPENVLAVADEEADQFFTPTTYLARERKLENMARMGVLYQDLDDKFDARELHGLPPTILWETSPDHLQAIWFLSQHVDPQMGVALNRRLATLMNADHSSWIGTKVLRIPGTTNQKKGGVRGRLLDYDFSVVYDVGFLHKILPAPSKAVTLNISAPPMPTREQAMEILSDVWPLLDRQTQNMLTQRHVTDRSLYLTRLANRLALLSIPPEKIFGLLARLPNNKFFDRPDVLWDSVVLTATQRA